MLNKGQHILSGSTFLNHSVTLFRIIFDRIKIYIFQSGVRNYYKNLKSGLSIAPLKSAGVIIIMTLFLNIIFTKLMQWEISVLGWFFRGMLLILGICCLYGRLDWESVKENSIILKFLRRLL